MWFNQLVGRGHGFEWPFTLDVHALLADGWRPFPFREFIVKIHSRCDLKCDYCYMYEMADQTWRDQPRRMSSAIAEQIAQKIGEHARHHRLAEITLVLHGGEPLLAGHDLIWRLVTATRKAAGEGVHVDARVQTNGVGLDDAYLGLFSELNVKVGVSLDGGAIAHNRHRRFASGRGSYGAVSAGLGRLRQPQFRHLYSGLLCTVDLANDPVSTYESLVAFEPPRIDFLLPHGTWDAPPPGRAADSADVPYAEWLAAIFDRWYFAPQTRVRLFEDIMRLLTAGSTASETVGLAPAQLVVIETDGSIEQVDSLKAVYHGAPDTGLHIDRDSFDQALLFPSIVARQLGVGALSPQCLSCPVHQICGGGMYPHRYRSGTGFANPSVYCPDLMNLIGHVRAVLEADINTRLRRKNR
jgi:uncharacterized protein